MINTAFEILITSELLSVYPFPAASPTTLLSGPLYYLPKRLRHPPAGCPRTVDAFLLEFIENYMVKFSSIIAYIPSTFSIVILVAEYVFSVFELDPKTLPKMRIWFVTVNACCEGRDSSDRAIGQQALLYHSHCQDVQCKF
eukprot:91135-Pleurochrysis_carterae.AAC.1